MNLEELLGFTAATLTTVAYLPQAIRVVMTRSTKDISRNMYILMTAGICAWLAYGILKNDIPIILANLVTFCLSVVILYYKLTEKEE